MSNNLITLGREAVINDTYKKIDWLMCCFFFSKYSQSRLMAGQVISLPKIMQENTDDPVNLKIALQAKLTDYLDKVFSRVIVDVTIEDVDDSKFVVVLDINVSDVAGGNTPNVSVGYALTYDNSILRGILDRYSGKTIY